MSRLYEPLQYIAIAALCWTGCYDSPLPDKNVERIEVTHRTPLDEVEHCRLIGDEAEDLMDLLNRSIRDPAKFAWRYQLEVLFSDGTSSAVFINGSHFHINGETSQEAASGSYGGAYEATSDIEAYLDDVTANLNRQGTTRQ